MTTSTERPVVRERICEVWRFVLGVLGALLGPAGGLLVFLGCAEPGLDGGELVAESWSVTAWGEAYEIFPEVDPLVVGEVAAAHTHVTQLDGFRPLVEGRVEIVLSGAAGEQVFGSDEAARPGIFNVELRPSGAGDFDLAFRIAGPGGREEIAGGQVRVGTATQPGAVVVAPAPRGATDGGQPLDFLKEQQWRSDFATTWVRAGRLSQSVSGLARVRPPAGGETTVTAPVDGVLQASAESGSWPYVGLRVAAHAPLFEVVPRVAAGRSLSALEAELKSLEVERRTADARLSRLLELVALEATSRREVEEAQALVETLEAKHSAVGRDLETARSSRQGGTAGGLTIRAPFGGEIAAIEGSQGTTVAAGEALARLVRTDRVWLEVALSPVEARRVSAGGVAGVLLSDGESTAIRLEEGEVRLVAVGPELEPRTGTVTVLLEVTAGLTLGTTLEAQVLLTESLAGIVVPASAVVDDGGVAIVYLQLSGESFARQEVRVIRRGGDRLLVDGLVPGQRLVSRGGEAIRRASLMASGEAHGHVH